MPYQSNYTRNSYFQPLPELEYPSLSNDRTSFYDYSRVKNIFKRAILREDLIDSFITFDKYSIQGDERPDSVAEKFYDDPTLDWLILVANNIINYRDEWPMSQSDFENYVTEKYTTDELSHIHHWETNEIRDGKNRLIQPAGLTVDSDHTVTYLEGGVTTTRSDLKSVSYLQFEIAKNDEKREIDVLKAEYVDVAITDMKHIMEYERSNGFLSPMLKKTENPRILSPR